MSYVPRNSENDLRHDKYFKRPALIYFRTADLETTESHKKHLQTVEVLWETLVVHLKPFSANRSLSKGVDTGTALGTTGHLFANEISHFLLWNNEGQPAPNLPSSSQRHGATKLLPDLPSW